MIGEEQIRLRVEAMAAAIAADTAEGTSLSVLSIMDGSFMFCADLVRRLPMPVRLAFVPLVSVHRGGAPSEIVLPPGFPVQGADLLVVEDILDSGRTLQALTGYLQSLNPRRMRLAVLLNKPARREVDIRPDYVGFEVEDEWVVGYGLDADGLYRNLPYITYVRPE